MSESKTVILCLSEDVGGKDIQLGLVHSLSHTHRHADTHMHIWGTAAEVRAMVGGGPLICLGAVAETSRCTLGEGLAGGQTQGRVLTLDLKGKDLFWVGSDFRRGEFPESKFQFSTEDSLAVRAAEIWEEQSSRVMSSLSLEVCKPGLRAPHGQVVDASDGSPLCVLNPLGAPCSMKHITNCLFLLIKTRHSAGSPSLR